MVNSVEKGNIYFYSPLKSLDTSGKEQGASNVQAGLDAENKDLGPKDCKT